MTIPAEQPVRGPGFSGNVPIIGSQKIVPFSTHYVCNRCHVKYTLGSVLKESMLPEGVREFFVIGLCKPCAVILDKKKKKKDKDA